MWVLCGVTASQDATGSHRFMGRAGEKTKLGSMGTRSSSFSPEHRGLGLDQALAYASGKKKKPQANGLFCEFIPQTFGTKCSIINKNPKTYIGVQCKGQKKKKDS